MINTIRSRIAGSLVLILLGLTILQNSVVAADITSDNVGSDVEESFEVDDNDMIEKKQIDEMEGVSEENTNRTEQQNVNEENLEDIVDLDSGLINYVGVESPYLQTPNVQQIVISFGDGSESISDAKLICNKMDGNKLELDLCEKEDELFLFKHAFEANESGVYQLDYFVYVLDGVEQIIDLSSIGIEAMFGVDEYYPGYEAESETGINAEDIEMSIVNVETDNVDNAESDIEEAINVAAEEVEEEPVSKESDDFFSKATSTFLSSLADIIMPATTANAAENVVVVLDPGHGGSDSGAVGNNGLLEKNITLKIAQYCKAELEEYNGVSVYMTRESDVYVGLSERVQKAKAWGADVFVSLHINAGKAIKGGAEVWYPNSSYNSAIHNQGASLSSAILEQLTSLGLSNRGIKERNSENGTKYPDGSIADYYSVIRDSKLNGFPGIIVEHAFIDNASDAAKLEQESFLEKLGIADATGIANYFELNKNPSVQITNKNDFLGTAQINVAGLGNNATVTVWNEEANKSKTYVVENGKSTLEFNISDYENARGMYFIEAIDVSGISLYKSSFYVSKDTSSDISIQSDGTDRQWTVNIKFADMPSEVKTVQIPVWTAADQSDIIWYNAKQTSEGNWQATINFSDYKKFGLYNVHVYAGLSSGVGKFLGSTTFEVTKPTLSVRIDNYNQSEGTFEVIISDVVSKSGVSKIQVPVWCAADQSDIRWYDAVKQNDGSYKVTVSMSNHNFAVGEYKIHTYITTGNGMMVFGGAAPNIKVSMPDMSISAVDTEGTETRYTLRISNVGVWGIIKNVQFATWSSLNGQDDIIWYNGTESSDGEWIATADIGNHKSSGIYNVHVYATLANGTLKYLGATTFEVTKPSLTVCTENYEEDAGTFDVVISNIISPSGVNKIQVPVWCAEDQSDIKWYDAIKQNDGSYKVTVSMSNHNFSVGEYKIHTYITTGNGMLVFGGAASNVNVIMPNMEISATDPEGTETNFILKITNPSLLGVVRSVYFATWSVENGQDDLIWYSGIKNSMGEWTATADIKKHRSSGTYNVHVYVTLANGTMRFLGATTFEVTKPSVAGVSVQDYDESSGMFKVVVMGASPSSYISKVQVPVWCASDQSDIRWYDAVKQTDGSYVVNVDPMYHNYNSGLYKIHVYITTENGIFKYVGSTSQLVTATAYYNIMGGTTTTVEQMMAYYESSGREYPAIALGAGGAGTLESFCKLYCEEAAAEGVRAEVAFAQAMKETGWLQYGGIVQINQFNFAGLGAVDGNSTGQCASFPDVRTGIRAQIQHLKAYACAEALNNECVDPRFNLVSRGCAPYVEWLGQKENPTGKGWATAEGYGISITSMIKKLKSM